jgi:hypothetical protein
MVKAYQDKYYIRTETEAIVNLLKIGLFVDQKKEDLKNPEMTISSIICTIPSLWTGYTSYRRIDWMRCLGLLKVPGSTGWAPRVTQFESRTAGAQVGQMPYPYDPLARELTGTQA